MGHTLIGTATEEISVLGGLVLNMNAVDLPTGASPRNFDVDFATSSVFTRDGLSSVYGAGVNAQNFNWVESYVQSTGQINTLALDAIGNIWSEDVTSTPGSLTEILSGILPGSYANGATVDDSLYIMFSNLLQGTDRPRQYNTITGFGPISQGGPGASPAFQSTLGGQETGVMTAFTITGNVIAVTTDTLTSAYEAGQIVTVGTVPGAGSFLSGAILSVLGTPAPTTTLFSAPYTHGNVTITGLTVTLTPQYSYPIKTITQFPAVAIKGDGMAQSAGIGSNNAPGTTVVVFYATGSGQSGLDQNIANSFKSGNPPYVFVSGAPFGNGTWLINSYSYITLGGTPYQYFTYQVNNVAGIAATGSLNGATYQLTQGILTASAPVPNLGVGDSIVVVGTSPSGWDATYTIENVLTGGVYNIIETQMSASGVATYTYQQVSGQLQPTPSQPITVTNTLNGDGIFNVVDALVATVSGNTFTISGFASGAIAGAIENGVAQTSGTQFIIDPGATLLGTVTPSPIYGDATGGTLNIVGGPLTVGAGTRQGVVFFISDTGYETAPSVPVTFTTQVNGNYIYATNIPIGPPNTAARAIAFTEAGQDGVPGANFYIIPEPVLIPASIAGQALQYSSTIINDNITTSAKFTFTDAVLLSSLEIDVQGNDLFNLIELGSSGWCVPYASRMFYGLQLNKIQNFIPGTMSFDGGYLANTNPSGNANVLPLGWTTDSSFPATTATVQVSIVTGDAYYIKNTTGSTQPILGMITQSASQDYYQVPILNATTSYSVRIAASTPSGATVGSLTVDLTDYVTGTGYGTTYGSFSVPLSSMSTGNQVFTGVLISNTAFPNSVSTNVLLRVFAANFAANADVLIDRIEVFPTAAPVLNTQVYGSYVNNFESIDASGTGGIIDTSSENSQICWGGAVMKNDLYLLKTSSMYVTTDNASTEPGGWELTEVSPTVGTCGINAYDSGEGWIATACRSGIYVTSGRTPEKINQELMPLWNAINWKAAQTIVLRNDTTNRRLLCAVPLPTGPGTVSYQWLPNAIPNANPTSPNIVCMLNYQDIGSVEELVAGRPSHVTMFGTLVAVDQRRKWSLWQITSPFMDFITQADGITESLYFCNGISSGKIYQLLDSQLSDDGVAINSTYCTAGAPSSAKAKEQPIWGMHRRLFTNLQLTFDSGTGTANATVYKDNLSDIYAYTVPNGYQLTTPLKSTEFYSPLNQRATRLFTEISTNAVGDSFNLCRVMLIGKADPHAPILPSVGGNTGI